MARKKKAAPDAPKIVNISLTDIDIAAKAGEIANRLLEIENLKRQKADQNARMQSLIDEQMELVNAVAAQIRGGFEARSQASLKANEAGELVVPDKPFTDPQGTETMSGSTADPDWKQKQAIGDAAEARMTPEEADRAHEATMSILDGEKPTAADVARHLGLPAPVADAIAASGGEVDLSAAKAKNGKAKRGKVQPLQAQATPQTEANAVTVVSAPTSCGECGSPVSMLDASGVYVCTDKHDLGCAWTAVVETADTARALGTVAHGATA